MEPWIVLNYLNMLEIEIREKYQAPPSYKTFLSSPSYYQDEPKTRTPKDSRKFMQKQRNA
jgi:hypothetical protein